nr:MAG TPA: hypothetical protein [Caudoviricetes sp.]
MSRNKKNRPAAANNRTIRAILHDRIMKAYLVYHQFSQNARAGGEKY